MIDTPIRVCLAQPIRLLNDVITRALSGDRFSVVGTCDSSEQLLKLCEQHAVQVALTDSMLEGGALEEAVRTLLTRGTRTLVVSSRPLDRAASRLLLSGASGFQFADDAAFDSIAASVEAVAAGKAALHPDVALAVLQQWRTSRAEARPADTGRPSARELQVLRHLADGLTTRAIGKQLAIADKTVEAHKAKLYAKLGARNQAHAITIAAERGLLSGP